MSIEERIEKLEQQLVESVKHAIDSKGIPNTLTLKSPNGQYTIYLNCQDDGAGIWLTDSKNGSLVAIFNGYKEGASVGVFGNRKTHRATDVALSTNPADGSGLIQLIDKDNNIHFITPEDFPVAG